MSFVNKNEIVKITLCAPPRCSCPTISIDKDTELVVINDDFGGKVQLTFEEARLFVEAMSGYIN